MKTTNNYGSEASSRVFQSNKQVRRAQKEIPKSLPLVGCLLFMLVALGLVGTVDPTGVGVGSQVRASGLVQPAAVAQGAGESGCTDADFTPQMPPITVADRPDSVAVGDFNLDGKADMAVANSFSNDVTILLGDGTGHFEPPSMNSIIDVGARPETMAVGDFNQDGKADLATANFGSNDVTILLGNGKGNFTAAATSPEAAGGGPRQVAVGDFNLDGNADLAVANELSDTVTILLGDGTGNFMPPLTEAVGDSPFSVAVGDFNQDGREDLATANFLAVNLTILLGDGTGNFTAAATSPEAVGANPRSVAVGDFNQDGKADLATANSLANNVTILLGDGTGNFTPAVSSPEAAGGFPHSVAVGDFNQDGKADLATANQNSDNLTILLGDGNGNFTAAVSSPEAAGDGSISVTVGDFNQDGRPDLVTANSLGDNVTILINTCTVRSCPTNFTPPMTSPEDVFRPESVAAGDFNRDGKTDLATACFESVGILLGDGTGDFAPSMLFGTGDRPRSVAVGDFNRDGKADLATANRVSNNVSILLGDGTGGFPSLMISTIAVGDGPESVAVGDFNRDGKADLATANAISNDVTILLGDGLGDFTPPMNFPIGMDTRPGSVVVGDFNLDGKADLATANRVSSNVSILLGDGRGGFLMTSTIAVFDQPVSVAVGDFNRDGKADLAVAREFTNTVMILLGEGTGNFTILLEELGNSPSSVAIGDFNLDGRLDLAATSGASNNVTILLGDGTGNFTTAATSPEAVGNAPVSVAVGDFNQDGRPDLATANNTSNNVTILLATCAPPPTIMARPVSQVAGTSSNKLIATVSDPDQPLQDLSVTISMALLNGVLVSNIVVDSGGNVTATVAASCTATDATFTLRVTDAMGAIDTDTLTVTVTAETTPPIITCPTNITQGSDSNQCGAVVSYAATAMDNCPGVGIPACLPSSGTFFPAGTTNVTCTVSDAAGNRSSCSFTVTVNDAQRPGITCPPNQTAVTATVNDPCKSVTFTPTATDNCPGVTVVCIPPSGGCFPVGVTTVTCTATDASANTTTCSFTVSVFNARLQDDSGGCTNSVLINTLTGDYRWCCGNTIFTGTGDVTNVGTLIKLEHNDADRRVRINLLVGSAPSSGTGILQSPPGTLRCVLTDHDRNNDTCICGG